MKRLLILTLTVLMLLFTAACDCTVGGFAPGEHVLIYYTNETGDYVPVTGYADGNGDFNPCR